MEILIIGIIMSILCGRIASKKGHGGCGPYGWGLLFGIFALIYYACIPVKAKEK